MQFWLVKFVLVTGEAGQSSFDGLKYDDLIEVSFLTHRRKEELEEIKESIVFSVKPEKN